MRITYLAHSGFMVASDEVVMVFDYSHDPAHKVIKYLEEHPDVPVIFFASNDRPGHFNHEIFNLAQNHKRVYVLSNDIRSLDGNSDLPVQGMSAGDAIEDLPGGVSVKAYASTDKGVTFAVRTASGSTLFHGGDLSICNYDDQDSPRLEAKDENLFHTVINRIASENKAFDVVFFPVDVRLGKDFAAGAAAMIETVHTAHFFPMHFDGDYTLACDFGVYPFHQNVDTTFHCLHRPGESVTI